MTVKLIHLCFVLVALTGLAVFATAADRPASAGKLVMGDYDAEIRRSDGHVDTPATIQALKAMSANTYFYLVWHAPTDWDDLPEFVAAAEKEGIDVWVYLVPWSETAVVKKSWRYSEPYRTDYVRWAREIGKLSLRHKNIVGYVIDDFHTNTTRPDRFTPAYVREMVSAGKDVNPRLKFYPLLYFQQPWADFIERFGGLVDGVVVAYPKSQAQIVNALTYLNDEAYGATAVIDYPPTKPSQPGEKGAILADLKVTDSADASVAFYWDDGDRSEERGYHEAFVRVDGQQVWQVDTAGDVRDQFVEVDLSRFVRGRDSVQLEIGVYEQKGVQRYPVTVRFDNIRLTGFETPEMASEKLWARQTTGAFTVDLQPASSKKQGRFRLPMILMPAGDPGQYAKRYPEPATPRAIAGKVRLGLELAWQGRVKGVVTYCLPKRIDDPVFSAVKSEYQRAADNLRN